MAEGQADNERLRLAVLLTVLAVLVVAAATRYLGGGGVVGGSSRSAKLEYQARNLQPLEMESIGRQDSHELETHGNPFAFRLPPTPTPNLTPPPTPIPRPTMPPRPTPTPRIALGEDGKPRRPPPPFDREYIGHFGPVAMQVAAFR